MTNATIIGLGNIGSALAPLVARMPGVSRVTLVDPDEYTNSNLSSQAIDTSAPGRSKVEVQASSINAIDPQKIVEPIPEHIENVPIALLRDSILVCCVDNRRARQSVNRIAWRCGSPWIDAAVDGESLVRISTFSPAEGAPCLECGWDAGTYELLEQQYPCNGAQATIPATDAPAELGALAASLQAAELRKLLNGDANPTPLSSSQLMLDTSTFSRHLNRFQHNNECRFDHEVWKPEIVEIDPGECTLEDAFDVLNADTNVAISLEGHSFVTCLNCVECGGRTSFELSLVMRMPPDKRTCDCGETMFAPGFSSTESIRQSDLAAADLSRTLAEIGFRSGDVLTVSGAPGDVSHVEIRS